MKKYLGYVCVIIIGVALAFTLIARCESIDNSVSKENNVIELFA